MTALDPMAADCGACASEAGAAMLERGESRAAAMVRAMYLCPECGDKRCAKASNHRAVCDGGQE